MNQANPEDLAKKVLELIYGEPREGDIANLAQQIQSESLQPVDAVIRTLLTPSGINRRLERAATNHLHLIHGARLEAIRQHVPKASIILDLGGVNAPLYMMGYPYTFEKMFMIDLPPDDRHEMYSEIKVDGYSELGEVVIHYSDMTRLGAFEDASADLVWSGQSIEHVPGEAAERMVEEAFRVLEPGGIFALDTPNGAITKLHAATAGLEVVHPEHFIEYTVDQLTDLLTSKGFEIEKSFGTNEMPMTCATGQFSYEDFALGSAVHPDPRRCYSQFHVCRKSGG